MFKPVDWPETCYLQEAVYWLVFGRVPEFFPEDGGDARSNEEAFETGEIISYYDAGYSALEFRSAGLLDVDADRYMDAPANLTLDHASEQSSITGPEYIAYWEDLMSRSGEKSDTQIAIFRQEVENFEWRKKVDQAMRPTVERGRVIILQALLSDDLRAFGMREVDEESPFERVDIAADQWNMSFNWSDSELVAEGVTLKAVQVGTEALRKLFPKPNCKPVLTTTVEVYPGVVILSDNEEKLSIPDSKPRGRGRPKLEGGHIETKIRNWAKNEIRLKRNPQKKESFIAAAMEFSRGILEVEVKKNTVQGWLKDILPTADLPIAAENSAEK
ncbi:hypothetical protein [Rhizobium sp. HT1-10]|uniref:hypothetical protein n=1 Tax=Rhizobium sp. HT1-10 TaxID=3111638 RepID=UPI003C1C966F